MKIKDYVNGTILGFQKSAEKSINNSLLHTLNKSNNRRTRKA